MGVSAWLAALQQLLPPGRALTHEPDAVLTRTLQAIAAQLSAAQDRLDGLVAQWDPRQATSMLPDWERLLALPDACTPAGQEVPDRQQAAFGRLTELGGASRAYFIDLAGRYGEPGCTINEHRPFNCNGDCNDTLYSEADAFTWRVNIPHAAADLRVMTCNSHCQSALQMYTPSVIECVLEERKPAHTEVIFAYEA